MSTRSRLPLWLAVTVLAVGCAAGGVAGAGQAGRPHPAALAAFAGPARPAQLARPAAGSAAGAAGSAGAAGAAGATRQARNFKKGVSAWAFPGVRSALAQSGVHWYYTWATSQGGITTPRGVSFVPMIWGPGSVTTAGLRQARQAGHVLLTFNEPDMGSQSNMTVGQALGLWPRLMATGMRLSSPAVAYGGDTPGGWLDQFLRGAAARHYRVNFIALHWYGGDFTTSDAVSQLKSYLQAVWNRYHKAIWLTEFALIRFGASTAFPSPQLQAAFVTAATAMLQRLPYVWRYAWFALPSNSTDGSVGLFRDGAVPTVPGQAFEKVDAPPA
jgi:Glycosyl hydrolase catalytic core